MQMRKLFILWVTVSVVTSLLLLSSCGSRGTRQSKMPYLTKDKIEYLCHRWGGWEVDWTSEKFILNRTNHTFEYYRYGENSQFSWKLVGTGTYRESSELNGKINIDFDNKDGYRSSGQWKYGVIYWSRMELEGYPDGATLVCDPVDDN